MGLVGKLIREATGLLGGVWRPLDGVVQGGEGAVKGGDGALLGDDGAAGWRLAPHSMVLCRAAREETTSCWEATGLLGGVWRALDGAVQGGEGATVRRREATGLLGVGGVWRGGWRRKAGGRRGRGRGDAIAFCFLFFARITCVIVGDADAGRGDIELSSGGVRSVHVNC